MTAPDSSKANPACIKKIKNPVNNTHAVSISLAVAIFKNLASVVFVVLGLIITVIFDIIDSGMHVSTNVEAFGINDVLFSTNNQTITGIIAVCLIHLFYSAQFQDVTCHQSHPEIDTNNMNLHSFHFPKTL